MLALHHMPALTHMAFYILSQYYKYPRGTSMCLALKCNLNTRNWLSENSSMSIDKATLWKNECFRKKIPFLKIFMWKTKLQREGKTIFHVLIHSPNSSMDRTVRFSSWQPEVSFKSTIGMQVLKDLSPSLLLSQTKSRKLEGKQRTQHTKY